MDPARSLGLTVAAPRRIGWEVSRLAWPAIVQGLLHTVTFLADRLMLGRYDADALASMQISGPLLWSVINVCTAFTAGTIAVVGRSVGAGDAARTRRTVLSVTALALFLGVLVGTAGFLARGSIADLLAGGPETSLAVRGLAATYMAITFPTIGLVFLGVVATTILQASGDTRTPLRVAILAEIVNVAGNWILIYGLFGAPELGLTGAALATALSFGINGAILLWVLARRRGPARLILERPDRGHLDALRAVVRVSRAAFGEKVVFHAGYLAFVALIGRLGDVAMAANQALLAIESIGFIAANGFGIASGALVAQKLGAGLPEEAAAAGRGAARLGMASLSAVSLVFLLFPNALVGLFSPDPEIVSLGARCLLIAAFAQPLMAMADTYAAGLRGAGDTKNPMIVALVGPVAVRIAGTWFFALHLEWGLLGVWVGSTLDWLVRGVWMAVVFHRGKWKSLEV